MTDQPTTPGFTVTADPAPQDLEELGAALSAFNDADVGPSQRRPLAIIHRDGAGALRAGLSGYTAWGWLYVQWLWVAAADRGQGLAGAMLAAAEAEAQSRGCHGAFIDSFSPTAQRSYRRAGYRPFGELADFPVGRTRVWLCKPL